MQISKSIIVCLYLLLAYWVSLFTPMLKMFFFPTLGAIAFFFMGRTSDFKHLITISLFTMIASIIGSVFYFFNPGSLSFFLTCLITIFMIQLWKINAAPVLAVALIPFFAHPATVWLFPLSVFGALTGLLFTLWISGKLEEQLAMLLAKAAAHKNRQVEVEAEVEM
ncbi:MAG: hypothetical protein ACM32O_12325 [Clostridia bacterium]